jgi:hypothetical protein
MSKEKNMQLKLSLEVSRANLFQSQEKEKEQMTIDTSGMKLLESLENANPDGSLAKMLKVLLTSTTGWYSDRCKLIWKKKVSKSNVLLFQLQASVLGIKENESGLWLTPTATDIGTRSEEAMERRKKYRTSIGRTTVPPGNLAEQVQYGKPVLNMYPTPTQDSVSERTKRYKQGGLPLTMAVKMFPTPRVSDIEGGAAKNVKIENGHFYRENKKGERWGVKLRDVMEMYPTPRASAAMTEDMETIAKRNKYNSKLEEKIAMDMYPTPTARDWKDTGINSNYKRMAEKSILSGTVMMKQKKVGGKLNPEFVEFLMGYPLNWTKVETTE